MFHNTGTSFVIGLLPNSGALLLFSGVNVRENFMPSLLEYERQVFLCSDPMNRTTSNNPTKKSIYNAVSFVFLFSTWKFFHESSILDIECASAFVFRLSNPILFIYFFYYESRRTLPNFYVHRSRDVFFNEVTTIAVQLSWIKFKNKWDQNSITWQNA